MPDWPPHDAVARPTTCPFCHGRVIDTLAKVVTAFTLWRCRSCEATWTLARRGGSSNRPFSSGQ
jgi:hypothetical protein